MKLKSDYLEYLNKYQKKPSEAVDDNFDLTPYLERLANIEGVINANPKQESAQDFLNEIKNSSYNKIVELVATEAEKIASTYSKKHMNFDYYAGEFPTGEVNACAVSVEKGYLFLINTGLMQFFGKFTRLMALSIGTVNFSENGIAYIDDYIPTGYDFKTLASMIGEITAAYILLGDVKSFAVPKFSSDTRAEIEIYRASLLGHIELFVVLHEFAHAVAGHLNGNLVENLVTPVGEMKIHKKSFEQEYQADHLASRWMMIDAVEKSSSEEEAAIRLFTIYSGIAGFFCFVDLYETIVSLLTKKTRESTHPPALSRLKMITIEPDGESFSNHPAFKQMLSWYDLVRKHVINDIASAMNK